MSNHPWIIPMLLVGGTVVLWITTEGTAMEPVVDLLFLVAGGLLVARACLLRLGLVQSSRWGGYTSLGTFLIGIGVIVFFIERIVTPAPESWFVVEALGTLAFFSGVLIEGRAALRSQIQSLS